MRKITTAITAAALALNMLAATVPAAAVTGYDSAYAGESAFVNIVGGQTQNFQVFFANTGTTSWVKGTGTQVDLAACLEDKVTCNAQDASEATWNSGWLSAVRYASTSQTTTPPGSLGTFSYNITAPTGVAAGIYHFNGDVVLASTGEKIHPEGYFQDANTGAAAGAATITSIVNSGTSAQAGTASGSASGGDPATINGTGIICTPAFPIVAFDTANAVVTSCGSTTVTVTTPAHAVGQANVTLTNTGGGASNALTWQFLDTTTPKFNSFTVSGNLVTITFSEPVCAPAAPPGTVAQDWTVLNVAAATSNPVTASSLVACGSAPADVASSTIVLQLTNAMPNGSFVETTLNSAFSGGFGTSTSRNTDIVDIAGNTASAPQSRQATATAPESTAPTVVSATGAVGSSVITLTFSEPVRCDGGATYALTDNNSATVDPSISAAGVTNSCGTPNNSNSPTTADTSFSLETNAQLPADRTYTLTITVGTDDIQDIAGNDLATPTVVTFTTGAGDFSPPTMIDARITNNQGTTDFNDAGDSFSITFSEKMNGVIGGDINIQDQDGTTGIVRCGVNATCSWNTAVTTVSVALNGPVLPTSPAGDGTTPGMAIPFNITALTQVKDVAGNPPNVLGSADRLVDFE